MILAAKGLGESAKTNKHLAFRKAYGGLYHHMKPGKVRGDA